MPTRKKSLVQLRDEWADCTKCALGVYRKETGGRFVFGEGTALRGVMFIDQGPGQGEEQEGRPVCGEPGKFLREMIAKVGLNDCYYITSLVTCRSCEQGYDNEGNPRNDRHGNPRIVDKRPIPLWINECLPRLHEEIYLVDPKIIVTLGGAAAEALVKKPVGVMKESGIERTVEIPGAWQIPVLTEKRKVWVRKHRGEMISPTRTNMVRYLLIPLMRPAFVWDSGDKRPGNVFDRFYRDMKKVAAVYMRLVAETVECATE